MPAYQDEETGRWRYRFTFEGQRYSGSTPTGRNTKKCATELEREHIDRLSKRRFVAEPQTVEQFAKRFLAFQQSELKPLSFELQETIVRLHVLPHLGRMQMSRVDTGHLDDLKTRWTCEPRTKNTRLGVVQRMFSLAVDWKVIEHAPEVNGVKVAEDVPRFLTDAECGALIEAAGAAGKRKAHWREMVIVALRTGARIGELRGLMWTDIDFARRVLVIRRTDPGRADMGPNSPKGNRPRQIPLTADCIAALERAREGYHGHDPPTEFVWVSTYGGYDRPSRPSRRAAYEKRTSRPTRTRSHRACSHAMEALVAAAGLERPEELGWHSLRHTFASNLVMRGVSLSVVQELLGHKSIKQTERYAHLAPGYAQHAAIAALDFPILAPTPLPALPPGDTE